MSNKKQSFLIFITTLAMLTLSIMSRNEFKKMEIMNMKNDSLINVIDHMKFENDSIINEMEKHEITRDAIFEDYPKVGVEYYDYLTNEIDQ